MYVETDDDLTYCGEHCVIYRIVESLCCAPEINITLYVNYSSIKSESIYLIIKLCAVIP